MGSSVGSYMCTASYRLLGRGGGGGGFVRLAFAPAQALGNGLHCRIPGVLNLLSDTLLAVRLVAIALAVLALSQVFDVSFANAYVLLDVGLRLGAKLFERVFRVVSPLLGGIRKAIHPTLVFRLFGGVGVACHACFVE